MKKYIETIIIIFTFAFLLVSCGAKEQKTVQNKKTLMTGEIFKVNDLELGNYNVTVISAKKLLVDNNDLLQLEWEVENVDFNGEETINGETISNVVSLEGKDLTIKDDSNSVLAITESASEGEWINDLKPVQHKTKMIKKYTWKLNNKNTKYVTVSFNRMQNSEFKINIDS